MWRLNATLTGTDMIDAAPCRLAVVVCLGFCGGLAGCAAGIPAGPAREIRWHMLQALQPDAVRKNNAIRLSLWNAARTGAGTVTAKKRSSTLEGGSVVEYLTVRYGVVEAVHDSRKDPFGPPGITRDRLNRLDIGYYDSDHRFREGPDAPPGVELLIHYTLPSRGDWYF